MAVHEYLIARKRIHIVARHSRDEERGEWNKSRRIPASFRPHDRERFNVYNNNKEEPINYRRL